MRERSCSTSCANSSNDSDSMTPVGSVFSELGSDSRAGSTACSLPGPLRLAARRKIVTNVGQMAERTSGQRTNYIRLR